MATALKTQVLLREFLFNPISPTPSTVGRDKNFGISASTSFAFPRSSASFGFKHFHE